MFQDFLVKKMLKAQGVPDDQIEMITTLVNNNPALFKQIADEIQVKIKEGKDQMAASMEAMTAHKAEIEQVMKSVKN